jgi:hypothetical protein
MLPLTRTTISRASQQGSSLLFVVNDPPSSISLSSSLSLSLPLSFSLSPSPPPTLIETFEVLTNECQVDAAAAKVE